MIQGFPCEIRTKTGNKAKVSNPSKGKYVFEFIIPSNIPSFTWYDAGQARDSKVHFAKEEMIDAEVFFAQNDILNAFWQLHP